MVGKQPCILTLSTFFKFVCRAAGTASVRLLLSPHRKLVHFPPQHDRKGYIRKKSPLILILLTILMDRIKSGRNDARPSSRLGVSVAAVIAFPKHPQ